MSEMNLGKAKMFIDDKEVGYIADIEFLQKEQAIIDRFNVSEIVSIPMVVKHHNFKKCKKCGKIHFKRIRKWDHRRAKKRKEKFLKIINQSREFKKTLVSEIYNWLAYGCL